MSVILHDRCWLCIYCLFVFKLLAHLPVDHLPLMSSIKLYGANLLHSLIMGLIVLSLSPHDLHLLFCCVLSVLALISFLHLLLSSLILYNLPFLYLHFLHHLTLLVLLNFLPSVFTAEFSAPSILSYLFIHLFNIIFTITSCVTSLSPRGVISKVLLLRWKLFRIPIAQLRSVSDKCL